ncbi:acyl-CoA dehydrogenase family protein [Pararhodobacter sp. CCB-MM2]|uniref:acyl-CoA dehydrogenase family protein n=1 Tax=Pararhodobacter sp. CCB-MM2 TaxID=1786003 RepID=UPI00083471F2|nr:acyl-CoA dehydrogenase family protein [Pararhodobacter sp. CCB-MM2]
MPLIQLDDPDSTLAMLRDSVAALATRADGPATFRRRRAAQGDLDRATWSAMAEAGFLALTLPEDMGGMALGDAELTVLAEALGRALLTEPFANLAIFPTALLQALPRTDARTELAMGIGSGEAIVPVLWQDARGATAPLTLSGSRLNGSAHLVSGALSATGFLALAQDGDALVLLHLDASAEGLRVTTRPGLDGAVLGQVTLHDTQAGTELARGAPVQEALDTAIARTRLALAAELAGLGARALEITVEYTSQRVQFGKTIASFQAIQHRLVDMWAEAEFACSACTNAATAPSAERAQAVLAAKARAGDSATSITRKSIQLHGAMGFTDQCDIGLYLKRAITLNATLGQPEDLRLAFLAAERVA